MQLECTVAFGNFEPGDYVTVPDDTEVYDTAHFRVVDPSGFPIGRVVGNDD